jgi:hypothetical protein
MAAVKALPMVPCEVKNPAITINEKTISFPVEIQSGGYLEFNGSNDCTLYGPKGQTLAKVVPQACPERSRRGEAPLLLKGQNHVRFSCDQMAARVKVVVISHGDPITVEKPSKTQWHRGLRQQGRKTTYLRILPMEWLFHI